MTVELRRLVGFDDAAIGTCDLWRDNTVQPVVAYDGHKIAKILMERDGMSREEAYEFISFNIEGAYVGKTTPIIIWMEDEF